jgi:hypothetical protein
MLLLLIIALSAQPRSALVKREFQRNHPCPSTGKRTGACAGYVKDHIIPLCRGGPDTTENMQWQTITDAKAKDRTECPHRR